MWSWGSAQPVWGSILCLTGSFQLLFTQIGGCSSEQVETCELPPLAPWAFPEQLCCGSQGFQRSPQLGELEQQVSQQSWLAHRRQVATSAGRVRTKPLPFSVWPSLCALESPFSLHSCWTLDQGLSSSDAGPGWKLRGEAAAIRCVLGVALCGPAPLCLGCGEAARHSRRAAQWRIKRDQGICQESSALLRGLREAEGAHQCLGCLFSCFCHL